MKIYDQKNQRVLDFVTLFLTPQEASQIASDLKDLADHPEKHHHHINNEDYSNEIIVSVYTDDNISQFDEESRRILAVEIDLEKKGSDLC